ncbi:monocarboxylate transporter 1-like isoform X2 [Haemaphysalis longicornis]
MRVDQRFNDIFMVTPKAPDGVSNPVKRKTHDGPRKGMDTNWGIAAAAAVASFFNLASQINSGFFFEAIMDTFGVQHEEADWPETVFTIMTYSGSFFVLLLEKFLSVSHITLLGSFLLWLPLIGSVFAPNVTWLTVTFGVFHGAGAGIVLVSLMIVLGMHFDKYLSVASGLRDAGTTVCAFVFPSLLAALHSKYGLRGTILIYSGLLMNVTAIALYLWIRARKTERREWKRLQAIYSKRISVISGLGGSIQPHLESCNGITKHSTLTIANDTEEPLTLRQNLAIMKEARFYVVVLGAVVEIYGYTTFLSTIDDYALDKGTSRHDANMAISYATIGELAGYIGVPLLADKNIVSRPTLATTCFVLLSLFYGTVPLTTSLLSYVVVDGFLITFIAAVSAVRCSLMTEFFGPAKVPMYMAATGFLLIPLQLINPTIIGIFRDEKGSYDYMYWLLCGMHLLMVLLYAPLVYSLRLQEKEPENEVEETGVEMTKM